VTVIVHTPEGSAGAPSVHLAAGRSSLAGLRIGVLENGKPNADRLLTRLAERVASRTGAHVVSVTGKGTAATPCEPDVLAGLVSDVDVVVTGSAD
jgi:hypothetical protein